MVLILSGWFHCAAVLALNCGKVTNKKQDTWSLGHTGACKIELGSYGCQDLEAGKSMASLVLFAVWGQLVQSPGEMGLVRTTFLGAGAKAKMVSVSGGVRRNTAPWPAAATFLGSSGLFCLCRWSWEPSITTGSVLSSLRWRASDSRELVSPTGRSWGKARMNSYCCAPPEIWESFHGHGASQSTGTESKVLLSGRPAWYLHGHLVGYTG